MTGLMTVPIRLIVERIRRVNVDFPISQTFEGLAKFKPIYCLLNGLDFGHEHISDGINQITSIILERLIKLICRTGQLRGAKV